MSVALMFAQENSITVVHLNAHKGGHMMTRDMYKVWRGCDPPFIGLLGSPVVFMALLRSYSLVSMLELMYNS